MNWSELLKQLFYVALYIVGIGILGFLIGRIIPKRKLDHTKFPYKQYPFETKWKLYEKLGLKNWQDKAPDMSKVMVKVMPAKKLEGTPDLETVLLMVRETCMAELIHLILSLLGFIIPIICPNILGWIIALAYIVLGNLPYVVIQRYNRPRLVKLYETQRKIKQKKPTDVLILSAKTGGGHNSVARTIKDYYVSKGYTVDIRDALVFKSDEYSKFIQNTHNFLYNHMPWLFSFGWTIVENSRSIQFGEYSLNRLGFKASNKELCRCITDNGYSTVICTHVFAAIMIGDTVKKYGLDIRTGRVETDYMNTPGAEYGFVDYHFVPSYMMIPQMVGRGAKRESLVVSGIPLPEGEREHIDKLEVKKKLGIPTDRTHIFIMFGTEGNGPIEDILKRLKKNLEYPAYITIVCGRNEKLYNKLSERYRGEPDLNICGFVNNVPDIMDSTDIFIGKAGGISITEAASRSLAIMIVSTVGGCEKYNKEFFVNHGAAMSVSAVNYIAKECNMLIGDAELRNEVCNAAHKLVRTGSARIIFDTLTGEEKQAVVKETVTKEAPASENTKATDDAPASENTKAADDAPASENTKAADDAPASENTKAADDASASEMAGVEN